jgi:putative ABC transport system substrate-binding protein
VDRRAFLTTGLGAVIAAPLAAEAQEKKVWRIGYLALDSPERARQQLTVIEAGLRELGYGPGRDVIIELRAANFQRDRLQDLARQLVDSHVDLILALGNPAIAAAKQSTSAIPIIMIVAVNPIDSGFVASLARPGGNMTGISFDTTPDSTAKNLQLLKEAFPNVSRVTVLWDPAFPEIDRYMDAVKRAAVRLDVRTRPVAATRPEDVPRALESICRDLDDAVLVFGSPLSGLAHIRATIVTALNHKHLPSMYPYRSFVDDGGLMSYGTNLQALWARAAVFIDKIAKGAKAGDLPVEQPTKLELVINLKTAKALGLTIPQSVLLRADEVID